MNETGMNGQSERVKVVVRCRPMNDREFEYGQPSVFQLTENSGEVLITKPAQVQDANTTLNTTIDQDGNDSKLFTFDHAYDDTST